MYRDGLGLELLGGFRDHEGFDGAMLGRRGLPYHCEFTNEKGRHIEIAPTDEDLIVFYIPDQQAWKEACTQAETAGFRQVASHNPYWERQGQTFEDLDGYRIVLQNARWPIE